MAAARKHHMNIAPTWNRNFYGVMLVGDKQDHHFSSPQMAYANAVVLLCEFWSRMDNSLRYIYIYIYIYVDNLCGCVLRSGVSKNAVNVGS